MKYTIKPAINPINVRIALPGSKSITNRALILASLAHGESILHGILSSEDTTTCMQALRTLGVIVDYDKKNKQCRIEGTSGKFPIKKAKIWCKDAGTVARFLLAACAGNPDAIYHFSGTQQLQSRPMAPLLEALQEQGVEINSEQSLVTHLPITLTTKNKPLHGGRLFIAGDESSQFLSALLMIAPYAESATTLKTETLVSQPYIQLTCQMMEEFGVPVNFLSDHSFYIEASQCYQGRIYDIEPDLSTASYFFAAAAVTAGTVTIPNIHKKTCKQGDITFLNILENMGCMIEYHDNAVTVHGTPNLRGQTVDMSGISDTMMTLACIAPFADTPTTITHIAHVRYKESDRIAAIVNNLRRLGIETQWGDDYITIFPGIPKADEIDSYGDHRIAMSFALIGLRIPGIIIQDIKCVAKTCPDFIHLWEKLIC